MTGLVPKVPNSYGNQTKTLTHLPKRPPVDIKFVDLSYTVYNGAKKENKALLNGVSGAFKSGKLTAILGPSGAGKSTLMNILAGYKTSNVSGSIFVNGEKRNLSQFRKLSCYIMQDNCLLPHLTVKESMAVSAYLKLGKDVTCHTKNLVIQEILEMLGLIAASDTRAIHLSGGQKKRLAIALELVNNPHVMFFDEPTSGLDSSSSFQCISLLKSLSKGGRTIICTIHQPSARVLEKFDFLYTLADGQCIYNGVVPGLVPFLSSMGLVCPNYHNPAVYVIEVATGEYGDWVPKLVAAVKKGKCGRRRSKSTSATSTMMLNVNYSSSINKNSPPMAETFAIMIDDDPNGTVIEMTAPVYKPDPQNSSKSPNVTSIVCTTSNAEANEYSSEKLTGGSFPTSGWEQFSILLKRTLVCIYRDQTLTHMRLLSHVVVGLLIGVLYYGIGRDASKVMSNAGCIFFTVLFTMFTAMIPTILTFPTDMNVLVREHLNYWYSLKYFYLAKTLADLPFQILFSTIYVLIIYFMTGQPLQTDRALMFIAINIMTALVAQSLGLLIGAGMKLETGIYMGPVTSIPIILFSGFFINFNAIPGYLHWLTYLSFIRYGFEGAIQAIYGFGREKLLCTEVYCQYRHPGQLLEDLSMDKANFWVDIGALSALFVFMRVIAYFVLMLKLKMMK